MCGHGPSKSGHMQGWVAVACLQARVGLRGMPPSACFPQCTTPPAAPYPLGSYVPRGQPASIMSLLMTHSLAIALGVSPMHHTATLAHGERHAHPPPACPPRGPCNAYIKHDACGYSIPFKQEHRDAGKPGAPPTSGSSSGTHEAPRIRVHASHPDALTHCFITDLL